MAGNVHIKIRVIPTRDMDRAEVVKLIRQAIRTRVVPKGIEIAWADWETERSGRLSESHVIDDDDLFDTLYKFAAMRRAGGRWRIARARSGRIIYEG